MQLSTVLKSKGLNKDLKKIKYLFFKMLFFEKNELFL